MTQHTVHAYDDELGQLKTMIAQMGGLAEEQLSKAVEALVKRDTALADEVIAADTRLDVLERQVEAKAIHTIAKRQPMARDLREIMVAIRVSSDLERIGDLAKNTAKRAHAISDGLPRRLVSGLARMGQRAQEQLNAILDAYAQADDDKAMTVWRSDEELDALYNSIFRELLTYMMEDPRNISLCTHLLFGAKNMERIGDHTTNIAENIHYMVSGQSIPEERPKKDKTSITPGPRGCAAPDRRRTARSHPARLDAARRFRHRSLPPVARQARNPRNSRHHAHRPQRGTGKGARPVDRRRRLYRQAVLGAGADGPAAHHPAPRQSGSCGGVIEGRRPGARPPHQARAHVLHAGQFHLQLALMAAGPLGKYFENQKCPLVDRQTDMAFEIALLRRAQGLIKQDFLCTVLLSQPFDLVCLPAAYKQCGIGCLPLAGQARNRGEPGGLRQQTQLLKFGIKMRQTKIHTHQYGARGWRDGGISQTQFGSCSEVFKASRRARGHRTISLRQARHLRSQQS
jgi:phosphate transport system protein